MELIATLLDILRESDLSEIEAFLIMLKFTHLYLYGVLCIHTLGVGCLGSLRGEGGFFFESFSRRAPPSELVFR